MNIQKQLFMSSLSASTLWHPRKKPLLVRGTNIIPDDVLLSNIFIRLEAKQVAQMRSLSKTWNSLLSHPSFIKSHLDHSKDTNDEILFVFQDSFLNMNEFVVDGHDGRLHYLCRVDYGAERTKVTIVAFDLGDETFSEIALPDSVQNYSRAMEVGVLSEKLCVMSGLRNGGCEVWVMENYGVATSWVKCHVIPKYKGHDIYPIGFTSNNQFLFAHGIHLSSYDLEASTFRDFKGVQPFSDLVTVVQYVDSLLWVTPAKWPYNDVSKSSSQIEKKQHLLDG